MKISIGADHGGTDIRQSIIKHLNEVGHEVTDHGTDKHDSVDYPDFATPVGKDVQNGNAEVGILVCTTGIGISISANKMKGIRAALAFNPEVAALTRQHNNANVLCLAGKWNTPESANAIVDAYLNTEFEGGRHERRVNKIMAIENAEGTDSPTAGGCSI